MSSSSLLISLAILTSSFWGSWHCAAMCGPIASLMARKNSLLSYHLGRGVSYVAIGTVGGYLGSFFLKSDFYYFRIISGFIFAAILIFMGIQNFKGKNPIGATKLNWIHSQFKSQTPGYVLGLITVFLPCGWLYTYVLAAVATQSPWAGSLIMLLFWVGGIPALSAVSLFLKKSIQLSPQRQHFMAGMVLIGAGLYSLISFYFVTI